MRQGGSWENPPYNFDNFFSALRTLFLCAQGGGWEDIIESGISVTDVYQAPKLDSSWEYVFFFWSFIIINSLFLTNIFIGILTNYFIEAEGAALLTENQSAWVQAQIFVLQTRSRAFVLPPPKTIRRVVYDIVSHRYFLNCVDGVIICNIVAMLFERVPSDLERTNILLVIQVGCTWFFTVEVIMRAYAYGISHYWEDHWCKFDVGIVSCTWISTLSGDFPGVVVMRGMRVMRLLMLAKKIKSIKPITRTLLISIPACFNIVVLTLTMIFLFAVAAMNLYGLRLQETELGERFGQYLNENNNFDDFWSALKYLIQLACGMDWMPLAYELENHGLPYPWIFFTIYVIMSQWLFLNLFMVTLIHNFMKCFVISKMELQVEHALHFKEVWTKGFTDPNGPFGGQPFATGPDFADIDVRMIEELVPMLLPPTEIRDAVLLETWSPLEMLEYLNPKTLLKYSKDLAMTPQDMVDNAKELGQMGGKLAYAAQAQLLAHLTTMETVSSPVGLLVPHRDKSPDELAIPFTEGTIAHVDGYLVEILETNYETEAIRVAALDNMKIIPTSVKVKYIESEEMPMVSQCCYVCSSLPSCATLHV